MLYGYFTIYFATFLAAYVLTGRFHTSKLSSQWSRYHLYATLVSFLLVVALNDMVLPGSGKKVMSDYYSGQVLSMADEKHLQLQMLFYESLINGSSIVGILLLITGCILFVFYLRTLRVNCNSIGE